jgi:hypothetical protein
MVSVCEGRERKRESWEIERDSLSAGGEGSD